MFPVTFSREMELCWTRTRDALGARVPALEDQLCQISGEERALVLLALTTLPSLDACAIPMDVLRSFARHAQMLREESPYCRDLPLDQFLQFVYYPRVNSEEVVDCRPFFCGQLMPRISGLSPAEAALEVNRWCGEHVTYAASDARTESPMTAYRCGEGRCGEESVFAVNAFRSVGIPARQIYVPYWAHCDDNHAWVEVRVDGKWQFLGACEPEPVLNLGWFNDASSRAPLVVYRTFFPYEREDARVNLGLEGTEPCLYNVTRRYARTSWLHLQAEEACHRPAAGVRVEVSLVNEAALRPVAWGMTREDGTYDLELGRAGVHLEVSDPNGNRYAAADLQIGEEDVSLTMTLRPVPARLPLPGIPVDADFIPPSVQPVNPAVLTSEQKEQRAQTLAHCAQARRDHLDHYDLPVCHDAPKNWQNVFRTARGNAPELYRFYSRLAPGTEEAAEEFLWCLPVKDFRDVTCAVLEAHFGVCQNPLPEGISWNLYLMEVLNPRIQNEVLEDWRTPILAAFSQEERDLAVRDPQTFLDLISRRYPDGKGRCYRVLTQTPSTTLAMGQADRKGRYVLFVAGLRTFGIPARLNPTDEVPEYWAEGRHHRVWEAWNERVPLEEAETALTPETGARFAIGRNCSLARWTGTWRELDQPLPKRSGEDGQEPYRISLTPGLYRLTTSNRLPNGTQRCRFTYFTAEPGENGIDTPIPLTLRSAQASEMLCDAVLEPFSLRRPNGTDWTADAMQTVTLLCFLEVGTEPTQHILNELTAASAELNARVSSGKLRLVLLVRGPENLENDLLKDTLNVLPEADLCYDSFGATAEMLARKLFLEPGVWPLLVLAGPDLRGYYGSCGYQVGVVELALNLAECAWEEIQEGQTEQKRGQSTGNL